MSHLRLQGMFSNPSVLTQLLFFVFTHTLVHSVLIYYRLLFFFVPVSLREAPVKTNNIQNT